MELLLLGAIGLVLVPTLFVTGLHDVPNSIAIPVRTRALRPNVAVRLAAACNAAGVLLALPLGVYLYAWFDYPDTVSSPLTLVVVLAAFAVVLGWNLFTYFQGMPTSTTHALLAALLGGTLAALVVAGDGIGHVLSLPWSTPVVTLLVSPVVAFGVAYALVFLAVGLFRGEDPAEVNRLSRAIQSVTVGLSSLGTGLQQGQRFSFVLLIAFAAAGIAQPETWVAFSYLGIALLVGAGCLHGGWRIGHVLGHRLVSVDPLRGMVATTSTAGLLFAGSLSLSWPLSTSLTAASSIIGAGANQRFASVNWRQFRRIVLFWAATPLVSATSAAVLVLAFGRLVG